MVIYFYARFLHILDPSYNKHHAVRMVIWAKTDAGRNASEKSTSVDQGKYLRLYLTKKLSNNIR